MPPTPAICPCERSFQLSLQLTVEEAAVALLGPLPPRPDAHRTPLLRTARRGYGVALDAKVVSTYSQQRCRCPASLYRWPPLPRCASRTQPAHCAAPSTMLRPEPQKQACACPGPGDPAAAANGFSFVVMRGWSTRGSSLYHSGSPTQPSRSAQSSMNSTRGATRTDRDTQDAKLNGRYTNTERKGEDKRQSGASQWEARRPSRLGVVHTHLGHVELHVVKLIPATTQVCDRGTGGGRGGDEPRELDSSSA